MLKTLTLNRPQPIHIPQVRELGAAEDAARREASTTWAAQYKLHGAGGYLGGMTSSTVRVGFC